MLFTSTVVLSVKVPPPDTRLPLISTRVRCDPSPRSETPETPPVVAPAPEAATTLVLPCTATLTECRNCSGVTAPDCWICS